MRKQIQEKLIKFATRVPVFMYLTDYRERSLKDVITQLEPGLFKKVTGLDVNDFNLLCSIGVFNASLMNDAIFKFKRYEDSSLSYTGIEKHIDDEVGGWDTVIRKEEYEKLFYNQQATMQATLSEAIEEVAAANDTPSTVYISVTTKTIERDEQPKKEFDCSAIKIGMTVTHAKFGSGKIVHIDKSRKYLRVSFSIGEKTFVMPSCFETGFLKI